MIRTLQRQRRLRSGKNTQKNHTKKFNDPDSQDGVVVHLEPDILDCEARHPGLWSQTSWGLGSITTNKASGGYGIPAELEWWC